MHFWQLFRISKMIILKKFYWSSHIFISPATFSLVVDKGLASFTESIIHKHHALCGSSTHWPLEDAPVILISTFQTHIKDRYLKHFQWNYPNLNSRRPHRWLDKITLGDIKLSAIRQQAITQTNVDLDLCRIMVSLGHNDLQKEKK